MPKISTFSKRLIGRLREMKEYRTALVMTLIPLSFVLLLEALHSSQLSVKIGLLVAGLICFVFTMNYWERAEKKIKAADLQEKKDRDNLTKAINDLVKEIRQDRAERKVNG